MPNITYPPPPSTFSDGDYGPWLKPKPCRLSSYSRAKVEEMDVVVAPVVLLTETLTLTRNVSLEMMNYRSMRGLLHGSFPHMW